MARGRNLGKSTRPAPSSRKTANALGYAKRHTLKSKALSAGDLGDVYEYQQDKVRRSKVKLQLERDEMGGARSGSEEEEEGPAAKGRDARPRLVGENDDDDAIGEDEDEEIDSDEAFEESDNERYAGFSFTEKVRARPIWWAFHNALTV